MQQQPPSTTPTAQLTSPPPRPRKRTVLWVAIVLGILLGGSLLVNIILGTAVLSWFAPSRLEEEFITGERTATDKILVIEVKGPIIGEEPFSFLPAGTDIVSRTIGVIKRAAEDEDVKAIILRVDSPGGAVTDCDNILHQFKQFKKKRPGVPIIALFENVAASGGYYISCSADLIIANPTTVTGSIGVIMEFVNAEGLLRKIGVRLEPIKSGDKKDMGSIARELTKEERKLLQEIVNRMYNRFVDLVTEGRKMKKEEVLSLADGRVFTGEQARQCGLVDKLGYFDDAINQAKQKAGLTEARVIRYTASKGLGWLLGLNASRRSEGSLLGQTLAAALNRRTPRLLYMWTEP
jgi:protease-4